MFNAQIYQNWGLHQDATQTEINYRFYVNIIDVLNTRTLKLANNQLITQELVVNEWIQKKLIQINNEFEIISTNFAFPKDQFFYNINIKVKSIFRCLYIANNLKITNYKSQIIDEQYEPLLFKFATLYLPINILEEWICLLTKPILKNNFELDKQINIDWKITINKRINNTIWYLENLCLWFKDIYNWYTKFDHQNLNEALKIRLENILNHWVIYVLTNFYLKYIFDQNNKVKVNYKTVYTSILHSIKQMVNDQIFAVISFKSIAFFINLLLKRKIIDFNDVIIHNFKLIIKITSSLKNQQKLDEMMFMDLK